MEKKIWTRYTPKSQGQEGAKYNPGENGLRKGQYSKKKEYEKSLTGKKLPNRGGRAGQRICRSKEKITNFVAMESNSESEIGSLQKAGSKKQNITHLMNWWGSSPGQHRNNLYDRNVKKNKNGPQLMHFTKEHYLQANCQFVVSSECDLSLYSTNPDLLVDWNLVEEVWLHVSQMPSCPICLYPPTAARISRCGHIFCFPCILHFLALTDRKWVKCPICFDAVSKDNLKSVVAKIHDVNSSGGNIEFKLMCRPRDSLIPVPVGANSVASCKIGADSVTYNEPGACSITSSEMRAYSVTSNEMGAYSVTSNEMEANLSTTNEVNLSFTTFADARTNVTASKFIVASKNEILQHIIGRDENELKGLYETDKNEPEACFILDSFTCVQMRKNNLEKCDVLNEKLDVDGSPEFDEFEVKNRSGLGRGNFRRDNRDFGLGNSKFGLENKNFGGGNSKFGVENQNRGPKHDDFGFENGSDLKNRQDIEVFESIFKTPDEILHENELIQQDNFENKISENECFIKNENFENEYFIKNGKSSDHTTRNEKTAVNAENSPKSMFYFYQEIGGDRVYLHPLNVHMLIQQYGDLEYCPTTIKGRILEKEACLMTLELRDKFRYLKHLPVASCFDLVEIEFDKCAISEEILQSFKEQLHKREKCRKKREKAEQSIERRVKKEEDKLMGRSKGANFNTTSTHHFPHFTDDFHAPPINEKSPSLSSSLSENNLGSAQNFDSSPSFAQMIRSGHKKPPTVEIASNTWSSSGAKPKTAPKVVVDEVDGEVKETPDFGTSFSEAFSKALDLMEKNKTSDETENKSRGKKSKKKKGIILLSSGGR